MPEINSKEELPQALEQNPEWQPAARDRALGQAPPDRGIYFILRLTQLIVRTTKGCHKDNLSLNMSKSVRANHVTTDLHWSHAWQQCRLLQHP